MIVSDASEISFHKIISHYRVSLATHTRHLLLFARRHSHSHNTVINLHSLLHLQKLPALKKQPIQSERQRAPEAPLAEAVPLHSLQDGARITKVGGRDGDSEMQ